MCAHSIFPCQGHGALIDTDAEHLKAGGEGAEPREALEPGPRAQPHGHGNLWFFLQRLVATKKPLEISGQNQDSPVPLQTKH